MNDLELDNIRINLSPQKLEELIKDYYLCLDSSIKNIKVNWHQRHLSRVDEYGDEVGCGYEYYVIVETQREIYALNEVQKVKDNIMLEKRDLEGILKEILIKEKLVFDCIYPSIFDDTIKIECHKFKEEENLMPTKIVMDNNEMPEIVYQFYNFGNKIIDKVEDTLKKVLKL